MALFNVPKRPGREQDKSIASKSKSKTRATTTVKGSGLLGQINQIKAMVEQHLGQFKDDYEIITTKERLKEYIDVCIANDMISIDTETTGLDPILDKIVGLCLYTPNEKAAYVPINHVSYVTGVRVDSQLSEKDVAEVLNDVAIMETFVVMFNAKFDIRVIRNQLGVSLICDWDCYLAGRLLNENEESKGLKALHQKYVLDGKEDEFKFDALFKGITADKIPIQTFYLYAAHDAIITYELYQYQKQYLYYEADKPNEDRNGMNGVSWVFFNIEMPCIKVVCDMEDNGVKFDFDYQQRLSEKYNKLLKEKENEFYKICNTWGNEIYEYRRKHKDCKLDDPINIGSPTQIAILLYDILQIEPPDPKSPRGTGEAILQKIDNPIAKAILDYREMSKLVSTYIDKLPNCVNPKDGRIHCSFNQYGADTGRFSSSDPNLQNIPSHNKDIRKMFVASDGYVLMSSDYSQQEPKVMTQMCGDPKMIKAYQEGKDLYAEIAALSFNTTYENCLEFRPDGTTNPEGKNRRSQAKSILLGVLYGRGVPSIAEQLGTTTKKAQAIKDSVFKGFPAIPKFEQDSLDMAYEKGYVTTLWGRKRRLPDLQLPEYEFRWKDGVQPDDDLLDFELSDTEEVQEVPEETIQRYTRRLRQAYFGQKRKIFEEANKEGIWIVDNGAKIADAQRQCVNARIQGSAADMSKLAMILVGNDERLKELGFRLLIPVHDELIAECPEENVEECSERFAQLMSEAAKSRLEIPIKCDVEITRAWYGESM
jgi:DNA polymerase I-like protein with 3'-5' exonuclease and polymerase domains